MSSVSSGCDKATRPSDAPLRAADVEQHAPPRPVLDIVDPCHAVLNLVQHHGPALRLHVAGVQGELLREPPAQSAVEDPHPGYAGFRQQPPCPGGGHRVHVVVDDDVVTV